MKQNWEYVFRASNNSNLVAPVIAETIKNLGMTKVAVFESLDDSGKSGGAAFREVCKRTGITVTTVENFIEGDTDLSGQVARIINSGAETVFPSTFGSAQALIAKQLRQFGFEGLVFNREVVHLEQIGIAGTAADYYIFAYPYVTYTSLDDIEDPIMKDFQQKFYNEYGKLVVNDCGYRAWDSIMVLWEAVKRAGSTDSEKIKDALNKISGFKCLGGTLDFTSGDREGLKTFRKFIILNGKYSDLDAWLKRGGYEELKKKIRP
jgi:branched-chain amino acid transport system substrate-binding protein